MKNSHPAKMLGTVNVPLTRMFVRGYLIALTTMRALALFD